MPAESAVALVPVPASVAGLPQTAVAQTQDWLWEKGFVQDW